MPAEAISEELRSSLAQGSVSAVHRLSQGSLCSGSVAVLVILGCDQIPDSLWRKDLFCFMVSEPVSPHQGMGSNRKRVNLWQQECELPASYILVDQGAEKMEQN